MFKIKFKITLLTLLILGFTSPNSAFAHAQLINTTPTANQILKTSPQKILLEFGEEMLDFQNGNLITVLDPNGNEITSGPTIVAGPLIYVSLLSSDVAGKYNVSYRGISNDGHKVEGSYMYSLQGIEFNGSSNKSSELTKPSETKSPSAGVNSANVNNDHDKSNYFLMMWHHHAFHIILTIGTLGFIGVWALYRRFNQ
jgi:methionine-rich copper-binding protein CopC